MTAMDAVVRRAEQQLDALEDVGSRLRRLTVREVSDTGRVLAEVDVTGALIDLELRPGSGGALATLATEIADTAMRAARRAFADRADLMARFAAEFTVLCKSDPDSAATEPNP